MRRKLMRGRTAVCLAVLMTCIAGVLLGQLRQSSAAYQAAATARQPPPKEGIEDFMKIKLEAINAAMEAAATDDYVSVEKAGMDLIQLSRQVSWKRRANAAYLQDTADFVQAAEFMIRMAQVKDSQGVAHSYGAVAACCLNCHRHVRTPKVVTSDSAASRNLALTDPHYW